MAKTNYVRAWHFVGDTLRDGRPIPGDGEWLEHKGDIVICESGLHASRDPFDALHYAPGATLCLVECDGIVTEHNDKLVCRRRRIVARKDATEGLRYFARMEALKSLEFWPDPPDIVVHFLMTGDESARAAARAAAWDAARAAARDAAWDAAWAAAWTAAWAAAWTAARDAARAAAWDAARSDWNQLVTEAFAEYLADTEGTR